jgi:hypothetical protein
MFDMSCEVQSEVEIDVTNSKEYKNLNVVKDVIDQKQSIENTEKMIIN